MSIRIILSCTTSISLAILAGCDFGPKNIGEETGDTGESDSGESSDTDAELICAEFTSEAECNAQGNDEITCSWATLSLATRTGDSCELTDYGYCLQKENFGDTAAGCGSLEGCEESSYIQPFYKIVPEGVLLLDTCGGTPEPGFSLCPSGLAAEDNPPECACACELEP